MSIETPDGRNLHFNKNLKKQPGSAAIENTFHRGAARATQEFPKEVDREEQEKKEFLEEINRLLSQDFSAIGLDKESQVHWEQVHLFKNAKDAPVELGDNVAGSDSYGIYMDMSSMKTRWGKFVVMLHEVIHLNEYRLDDVKTDPTGQASFRIREMRRGYSVIKGEGEAEIRLFTIFKEAVVQLWAMEIAMTNSETLAGKCKLDSSEFEDGGYSYNVEIEFLMDILHRVAQETGEDYHTVWVRVKQGLITGEMMHLRRIEKVFGKGSLRVLAEDGVDDEQEALAKLARFFT